MENDLVLYNAFFQKQQTYYISKLERFNNGEKYLFNVAAFFFGITWMLYRKMYLKTLAFFGILFVEVLFEQLIFGDIASKVISLVIKFTTAFAFGTLANYFYLQKAKRKVEFAKATYATDEERLVFLRKEGGTNFLAMVAVIVCVIIVVAYFISMNNRGGY